MLHWVDKAIQQVEEELENGGISDKEYREQVRDIYAEHEQEAHDAAEQAYRDTIGCW